MKARILISIIILVLAVLIIAGSCATDKMTFISKEYEIYGTWVNSDYSNTGKQIKMVFYHNGIIEYFFSDIPKSGNTGEFVITNKWTDSKGNIWYTLISIVESEKLILYMLTKISNSGKTLEVDWTMNDYPEIINPNDLTSSYRIYYRQ
jgi:hypothetical protein